MTWKRKDCNGTLMLHEFADGNLIDIRFDVECKMDGVIDIQIQPVQWGKEASRLFKAFHTPEAYVTRLLLSGKTSDGIILSSNRVYIVGASLSSKRGDKLPTLRLSVDCDELLTSRSDIDIRKVYDSKVSIQYLIQGFRCFRTIRWKADVGEIKSAGITDIKDYNRITGYLNIKTEQQGQINDLLKRADDQVDLILDIFSLAGGRYLNWARKSLWLNNQWIQTIFRSPIHRGKPEQPVFHFLDMQPILVLAIDNYSKELKEETGFNIALQYFLISSLYIESRFATDFIALEHFVNTYAQKKGDHNIIDDREFNEFVIPEVKKGLKRAKESIKNNREALGVRLRSVKKAFEAMSGKVKELNRYTFVRNMWKFIQEYDVPLHGLSKTEIEQIIQIRHTLIHSGSSSSEYAETHKIKQSLMLLRELLTRIFLTLLKYKGQYNSFLNGHQYVQFPPN